MRKRIVGFTGNRAELFIQSNLFIRLSNSKEIEFELIAYDNGKDDTYTKQLINLQNNGVKLAQVITEAEELDENNIHNETMVKIMSSIDKNIITESDLGIVYVIDMKALDLQLDCSIIRFLCFIWRQEISHKVGHLMTQLDMRSQGYVHYLQHRRYTDRSF